MFLTFTIVWKKHAFWYWFISWVCDLEDISIGISFLELKLNEELCVSFISDCGGGDIYLKSNILPRN